MPLATKVTPVPFALILVPGDVKRSPAIIEEPPVSVKVPPAREKLPVHCMLRMIAPFGQTTVTLGGTLMTTSSEFPGNALPLQF